MKLRATVFVVTGERHQPSDHCCNRALIFLGEPVQEPRREREQHDPIADLRFSRSFAIYENANCSADSDLQRHVGTQLPVIRGVGDLKLTHYQAFEAVARQAS
jgi:hypothetical protein